MVTSIHVPCPLCGEEVEVEMIYEQPEYDVHIEGGWIADGFFSSCTCPMDAEHDEAIAAEAERMANADPEFGVTHWENY